MKRTAYLYSGPLSSASLCHEGETVDVRLIPGKTVELPADHEYTLVLLHLKQLTPAPPEAEVTTDSPAANGDSPADAASNLPEQGAATETKPAKAAKKPASATTDGGAAQ